MFFYPRLKVDNKKDGQAAGNDGKWGRWYWLWLLREYNHHLSSTLPTAEEEDISSNAFFPTYFRSFMQTKQKMSYPNNNHNNNVDDDVTATAVADDPLDDASRHKKRMLSIWEEMRRDPPANCTAAPRSEVEPFTWDAAIFGPVDLTLNFIIGTPYEGGIFRLIMEFHPETFFRPPKEVYFTTPVFHPNVSASGQIGLDVLGSNYSPALTIPKLLLSICSLLTDPNPREVYNRKARTLFLKNRKKYEETVVEWTRNYAID